MYVAVAVRRQRYWFSWSGCGRESAAVVSKALPSACSSSSDRKRFIPSFRPNAKCRADTDKPVAGRQTDGENRVCGQFIANPMQEDKWPPAALPLAPSLVSFTTQSHPTQHIFPSPSRSLVLDDGRERNSPWIGWAETINQRGSIRGRGKERGRGSIRGRLVFYSPDERRNGDGDAGGREGGRGRIKLCIHFPERFQDWVESD